MPAGFASPSCHSSAGSPKFFSVNCSTAGCNARTVGGALAKALTDSGVPTNVYLHPFLVSQPQAAAENSQFANAAEAYVRNIKVTEKSPPLYWDVAHAR